MEMLEEMDERRTSGAEAARSAHGSPAGLHNFHVLGQGFIPHRTNERKLP